MDQLDAEFGGPACGEVKPEHMRMVAYVETDLVSQFDQVLGTKSRSEVIRELMRAYVMDPLAHDKLSVDLRLQRRQNGPSGGAGAVRTAA